MNFLHAAGSLDPTSSGATMPLTGGFRLQIDHLDTWLLRIAIVPEAGFSVDRTWMIAPDADAPWEGRDRLSTEDVPCPAAMLDDDGWLSGEHLRVRAGLPGVSGPLALQIERRDGGTWRPLLADRATGAYQWLAQRRSFRHFQARNLTDRHYGLGDKTGPLDRTGRRLRCLQLDTLGYDAETTDPLYKHAPWLIVDHPERGAVGLFYDTMAEITFDCGAEHSNYHPHYRYADAAEAGMVLYVVEGPRVSDIVPRLHALTGRPHLPPRWSMGFAFTTMHHADAPDAQAVMTAFVDRARVEDIPLSALHSGSGYTRRADGRRYIFHWSDTRFPDRDGFFAHLSEMGLHSAANVKPVLLTEHPAYADSAERQRFIKRADGSPAVEMFWGGPGSQLDFTNLDTIHWWQAQLTEQILRPGFTAAWNDNNEAELWDETAMIDGFGRPLPAIDMRPVHALLMTRASFEATKAARPAERPYTITRAGPIGVARHAETWTGDNATSWKTLKWNLRQALSMSLSGMPFTGHDIGGFDGPRPDAELLIRWVQMMALHPRCVMNSWKPQLVAEGVAADEADCATLPWLYPEATPHVRTALYLRYRLLPYLYAQAHRAHTEGHPLMAPLFYQFDEPEARADQNAFLVGRDLLVLPVVSEGTTDVEAYLPQSDGGWHDLTTGAHYEGGQTAMIDAPLDRLPILVRDGAILPLATDWPAHAPHDAKAVTLTLFAGSSGRSAAEIVFDDGISWAYRDDDLSRLGCQAEWDSQTVRLSASETATGRGCPELALACATLNGRRLKTS